VKRLLFLLPLLLMAWRSDHRFYVSNTMIEFKANKGMLEVTMKIFTDDLEEALSRHSGEKIRFSGRSDAREHSELIRGYLSSRFIIKADNIPVSLDYLGQEPESDMTFLYFEGHTSGLHSVIEVKNFTLMEVYPEQINLVNFSTGAKRTTLTLDVRQPLGLVYP
jgi:hypothetical protein